jgi:hypothetical protein
MRRCAGRGVYEGGASCLYSILFSFCVITFSFISLRLFLSLAFLLILPYLYIRLLPPPLLPRNPARIWAVACPNPAIGCLKRPLINKRSSHLSLSSLYLPTCTPGWRRRARVRGGQGPLLPAFAFPSLLPVTYPALSFYVIYFILYCGETHTDAHSVDRPAPWCGVAPL